ncbi:MAG: hypothetical protein K9J25_11085 [Bacteroidales bacterium]|nr:hypothetical protein [Bacteroidales bacterium]
MTNRIIIISLLILCGTGLKAQYYETGQEPASVKWEKLDSYHFRFIYPESYSGQIEKYVYSFEKAYDLLNGTYKEPLLRRIPVIIHNYTTTSNGYVAWAPRRIELYPYPGQQTIPMDHAEQLALHELTHVLQMSSFRRGVSRGLSYLFGEQYTGALGIFTPYWFLEGEAIVSESAYSYSGRGRNPSFKKKLKAVLLDEDLIYSYDKMLFGSYRDYTPDHYQFGYQMSAWARSNFSDNIWHEPMDYVALRPYTLNPFNAALKKYNNLSKEEIYNEAMIYIKKQWLEEERTGNDKEYKAINPGKEGDYISYHSPVRAGRDSIIALRTSLSDIPSFVLINKSSGKEEKIHVPGNIWPYRISYSGNTVVWAGHHNDPRWQNRDYSVIKSYNILSGSKRTLTRKSRFFAPDISPDASLIVASESTADYNNGLVIIDALTGDIKSRYYVPGNKLISYPSWSDDMQEIVFISSGNKGEGIMSLVLSGGEWKTYLDEGWHDLQSVQKKDSVIFFVSSSGGTDNVFRLAGESEPERITSSRYGIKDISVSGDFMYFSDYSADGNIIASSLTGAPAAGSYDEVISENLFMDDIESEEKLKSNEDYNISSSYKKERYSKLSTLFRFHSWMPFYANVNDISFDNIPVSPGLTIMSQNNLGSLVSTAGYEYSNREHLLHSNIIWKGWYPAIEFGISYGGEPSIYNSNDTAAIPSMMYKGLRANTSIYIPLYFRHGRYSQTVYPALNFRYSNNYVLDEDGRNFDYGQTFFSPRLYLSNLHRMSYRDIWPRFGQVIDFYHTRSLFDSDLYGPQTTLRTSFYFPGLFKDHGTKLSYSHENQEFKRLLLGNRVNLPRGYDKHVIISKLNSFSFDYAMPLFYPDFNLGQFVYVNRVRSTFFYDYLLADGIYDLHENELRDEKDYLSSAGVELLADFYLLRIPVRLSAGLQAAWLPFERQPGFKFIFNMDVFGFAINGRNRY